MENPEAIHPTPLYVNYEIPSINGDQLPYDDDSWYPCPFFDTSSHVQDEFGGREETVHFTSSPWIRNEDMDETYKREELPSNGCGSLLREYNSVFSECWGDDYVSLSNGIRGNENEADDFGMMEGSNTSEEQGNGHYGDTENHPASHYDSWSCYDSWFQYRAENDPYDYSEEPAEATNSHGMQGIEVFEGIFGYWPCLYR